MLCSYENQTGFDDRYSDRRACSDFGWLLLLADGQSAVLQVGAGCGDWFSPGDLRVYHRVDHFTCRFHTIMSVTSCTECFVVLIYVEGIRQSG